MTMRDLQAYRPMSRIGYWLRKKLNRPIFFWCVYADSCRCTLDEDGNGVPNHHFVAHLTCRHCTPMPDVRCSRCGSIYIDVVPPGPQWTFSLWRGWRHTSSNFCREVR